MNLKFSLCERRKIMKIKKVLLGVGLTCTLLGVATVNVNAFSHGSLTFFHGREGDEAMAAISSTRTEGSMRIAMQLHFDDGSKGYPNGSDTNVAYYKLKSGFNWWKHGKSTADYFVNGTYKTSTDAPYPF